MIKQLAALLLTAATAFGLVEYAARSSLAAPEAASQQQPVRAENVRILAKSVADLPKPLNPGPTLLLLGNSHTYALPGLAEGDPLRPDPGNTLIDRLAAHAPANTGTGAAFDRLAYPNFLPFEMLVRAAQLDTAGYRPRVLVLGLTWRNLARDSALRPEVREVFHDQARGEAIQARLRAVSGNEVAEAVAAEMREAAVRRERERTRSLADRFDDRLTAFAERHSALLGQSADLRALIYRGTANWLQRRSGSDRKATYDLIPADLSFNLACLRALLRLQADEGTQIVVYWAPERSDLPPMMDPIEQERVMQTITAWVQELGGTTIDARRTVPDQYWGWVMDTPDRSHFIEEGHDRLALHLVQNIPPQTWAALQSASSDRTASAGAARP